MGERDAVALQIVTLQSYGIGCLDTQIYEGYQAED